MQAQMLHGSGRKHQYFQFFISARVSGKLFLTSMSPTDMSKINNLSPSPVYTVEVFA